MVKVGADLSGFKSNMADGAKAMKDGFGSMDLTQTNNAIKGLSQSVKLTESEFKAATAGMDDWRTNVDGLKARTTYLNDSLDDQKVILDGLNNKLGLTKDKYGEDSNEVNKLKININNQTAKIKENEAELTKVTSKLDNFGKETENASGKSSLLGDIFKGGFFANLASNALSAIGSKLQEFASAALDSADELMKLKSVTGKSAEELQNLKYVGDDLGVSLDTITGAQKKLTKSIGGASDGTQSYIDAFKELKVEYKDANGNMRNVNDVMNDTIDALGGVGNETKRDVLSMQLFGKSATELNPLIEAGSDTIKKLGEQAKTSGAIMSDDAVEALDSFGDSMDHVKQSAQTFVGETLAAFIGGNKTATESMSDLEKKLSDTSSTLSLIDKYKSLNEQFKNATISEGQLKQKSEELEGIKQQLITASHGLITAVDLENGSFNEQVNVFEGATKSEQEYLKYKLESVALDNTGASAQDKAKKASEGYAKARKTEIDLIKSEKEYRKHIDNGDGEKWEDNLKQADKILEIVRGTLSDYAKEMVQVKEDTAAAEDAIRQLVNNGFMTADQACTEFAISAEDLNRILRDNASASGTVTEEEAALKTSLENTKTAIEDLTTKYNDAHDAAKSSIDSQVKLFADLDTNAEISIDGVIESMQKQITYLSSYNENLKTAIKRGIDEGLIQQLSDGSAESAKILATIVAGTDTDIANINANFAKVSEGKETFSTTVAEMETDFTTTMGNLKTDLDTKTSEFNMYGKMSEAGKNTVQGYIDGISMQLPALKNSGTYMGDVVLKALDKKMRMASPSKEMKQRGKYTVEGYAGGIKLHSSLAADEMAEIAEAVKAAAQVDLGAPSIGQLASNNNANISELSNELLSPTSRLLPTMDSNVTNERKLTVGGEITVNGVNTQGELMGSTKMLAQELLRDNRRYPIG